MRQRIGSEEIIGDYVAPNGRVTGFKQARRRTVKEQNSTFESALACGTHVSFLRSWMNALQVKWETYKFSRLLNQSPNISLPVVRHTRSDRVLLSEVSSMRPSILSSFEGPKFVMISDNSTMPLAVLLSNGQWSAWQKEMEDLRMKVREPQ
jgi:hypothetical protein